SGGANSAIRAAVCAFRACRAHAARPCCAPQYNCSPREETMDVRAAVAVAAGKPLATETVTLDGPRAGEVLVEIKAIGICHTDAFTLSGEDPEGLFPAILGHEGGAIVMEIGAGVTSVKPGDHVIPLYIPECGKCKF